MSNWTDYVMNYAAKHGISYGEALKKAAPSYRKGGVVLGGRKRRSGSKSRMVAAGGRKRKTTKRMVAGCRKPIKKVAGVRRRPAKRMVAGRRRTTKKMAMGGSKSSMCMGGKTNKRIYKIGKDLGKVFGGRKPKKTALAALLSGINA